jgi:hypothetical protein
MVADRHSARGLRTVIALLALLAAGPALAGPKAVMELFTSQGCSSCPPADALFAEYAGRSDIIALSYSVDYWDYLGWTDTLASRDNTRRQKSYAAVRGDRQVYTPQMIIDGKQPVIGSDRTAVNASILRRTAGPGLPVEVRLSYTDDAVSLAVDAAPNSDTPSRATLWLVLFDNQREVTISRGENNGRTLLYRNVVRKISRVAMWKGKPLSIDLPRSEMRAAGVDGCAVLLQTESEAGLPGRILGAAMMRFLPAGESR